MASNNSYERLVTPNFTDEPSESAPKCKDEPSDSAPIYKEEPIDSPPPPIYKDEQSDSAPKYSDEPSDSSTTSYTSRQLLKPLKSNTNVKKRKKRVRKIQEQWTHDKTKQLIEEVKMREGTWNYLAREYRDRITREEQWQEVANAMGITRAEVSSKWNSVRCSFRASFNKMIAPKSGSNARNSPAPPFYNALKFLEPTLRNDPPPTATLPKQKRRSFKMFNVTPSRKRNESSANRAQKTLPKSPVTPATPSDDEEFDPDPEPSQHAASANDRQANVEEHEPPAKRCRAENNDHDDAANVYEITSAATKPDIWDDIGNFVASNGRDWAAQNPAFANGFRTAIYKLVFEFQTNSCQKSES